MLGFESKKTPITGEYAEKIVRWLRGEFTPEEIEQEKKAQESFKEARKRWKLVWENDEYGQINNI